MKDRIISIEPDKLAGLKKAASDKIDEWYQSEWRLIYPDFGEFRRTVGGSSFLACAEYLLMSANQGGQINVTESEKKIRDELGEKFSKDRFEIAVDSLEDGYWERQK